jgi:putative endonuclease
MYYCYILYSQSIRQTYTGVTSNLFKRLFEHNSKPTRTTARANDYKLAFYCAFKLRKDAEDFEIYLKSGSGRAFMKKHLLKSLSEIDWSKENDLTSTKL